MTAADLKFSLRYLGWSQRRLAEVLEVNLATVSRWATGQLPVPGYCRAYLDLALHLHSLYETIQPR